MATSKLNAYDKETIVTWYHNGWYSQNELADIYKVSRPTIQRVLRDSANYVGKSMAPVAPEDDRSSFAQVAQEDDRLVEEAISRSMFTVVIAGLALTLATFVGWVIYHAAN